MLYSQNVLEISMNRAMWVDLWRHSNGSTGAVKNITSDTGKAKSPAKTGYKVEK